MQEKYKGHIAVLTANVIFGLHIPVSKALVSSWMTPLGYMLLRILFASIIFWGVSLFQPKEKVKPKDLLLIAVGGLFGFTIAQYTFALALNYTTPVTVSLIIALSPVVVMLLAALFLKEKITRNKIIGVVLAIVGAALLILCNANGGGGSNNMAGILILLLNITCYSIYLIITCKISSRYSSVTLMKWTFLTNLIIVLPIGYSELLAQRIFTTGGFHEGWWLLAYVLLISTVVGYFLMPVGLKRLKATTVSIYMNMQPVVASVVAIIIGQDLFSWDKPVAALLVITGVYFVTLNKSKAL